MPADRRRNSRTWDEPYEPPSSLHDFHASRVRRDYTIDVGRQPYYSKSDNRRRLASSSQSSFVSMSSGASIDSSTSSDLSAHDGRPRWEHDSDRIAHNGRSVDEIDQDRLYDGGIRRDHDRLSHDARPKRKALDVFSDDESIYSASVELPVSVPPIRRVVSRNCKMTIEFKVNYKSRRSDVCRIGILGNRPEFGGVQRSAIRSMHKDLTTLRRLIRRNVNDSIELEGDECRRRIPLMEHDEYGAGRQYQYSTCVELDTPIEEHEVLFYRYVILREDDTCDYAQIWEFTDIDREHRKLRGSAKEVLRVKANSATTKLVVDDFWVVIGDNDRRNHNKHLFVVEKEAVRKNPYEYLDEDED